MPSDPTILAFDTSAAHCAAALLCGGRIVAQCHEPMAKGQGERLMGMLQQVLDDHGAVWAELGGLGVGTGPGNFTGTRIAVSAARGLALALGVPAIGVSSFEVLHHAHARPGETDHLISLAQRHGHDLHRLRHGRLTGNPMALPLADPSRRAPRLDDPDHTVVLGENAGDIAYLIEQSQGRPIRFRDCALPGPDSAAHVARLAAARLAQDNPRPAPLYVRAPDAAPPRDPAPVILP